MFRPGRCPRQGSRGPLACYGWCRAQSHNERADWPFVADREVGRLGCCSSRRDPWLDAVAAACGISGEVSLAVAADDSSGTCVRTCWFFWRLIERNDYELAGSHCGIQWRPRQASAGGGFLCRLQSVPAAIARFVAGCGRGVGEGSAHRLGVGRKQPHVLSLVLGLAVLNQSLAGADQEAPQRKILAGFTLGIRGLSSFRKQPARTRRTVSMEYRCVATSVAGFVQQLVSCYLPHGYWFYVSGIIPPGKAPGITDEKLLAKYGIGVSRTSRARRKAVGIANVHYLRYQRRFLLLATHGFHPFYDEEAQSIRDVRRIPIKFEGYSISVARGGYVHTPKEGNPAVRDQKWRVRVQIEAELYKGMRAYFEDIAVHRMPGQLAAELANLPFEPYAPVRQQLLNVVRYINRRREIAGLDPIGFSVLRYRRRIVRPFGTVEMTPATVSKIMKMVGE